jgi:hypothetical protein
MYAFIVITMMCFYKQIKEHTFFKTLVKKRENERGDELFRSRRKIQNIENLGRCSTFLTQSLGFRQFNLRLKLIGSPNKRSYSIQVEDSQFDK